MIPVGLHRLDWLAMLEHFLLLQEHVGLHKVVLVHDNHRDNVRCLGLVVLQLLQPLQPYLIFVIELPRRKLLPVIDKIIDIFSIRFKYFTCAAFAACVICCT
jgi:hypothetical protein